MNYIKLKITYSLSHILDYTHTLCWVVFYFVILIVPHVFVFMIFFLQLNPEYWCWLSDFNKDVEKLDHIQKRAIKTETGLNPMA